MVEYIEREAAKLRIFEYGVRHRDNSSISSACENLERQMNSIPAADVRPVVRAKWGEDWETGCSTCSACGESYLWEDYDGVGEWNFCPNCGAYMMEES